MKYSFKAKASNKTFLLVSPENKKKTNLYERNKFEKLTMRAPVSCHKLIFITQIFPVKDFLASSDFWYKSREHEANA